MSLFSLPSVMGRRSVPSDGSDASGAAAAVRPSVVSSADLNKQLVEEAAAVDQHLFFGPQLAVFEGAERTRVIHGERKIVKNNKRFWLASEPLSMDRDSTTSLVGFPAEPAAAARGLGIGTKVSAAARFVGQKVAALKFPPSHVNEDSFCDGCGMDPIVGNMYSCSRCPNYALCEGCYQTGIHGFEDSRLLRDVREDFALRQVVDRCKRKVPEQVFHVLLKTVCRGQVDKFNFLATWICAVVLNSPIHELAVRGIEVPHLDTDTRGTLVQLLTPVLAERTDLEVCMEWFCPDADNEALPGSRRRLETLRIWVATDKDSKSPFAQKKEPRDDDTESDLSPTSNGHADLLGSPGPASPYQSPAAESPTSTPPPSPSHADKRSHSTASSSSSASSSASPGLDALSLADKLAASQLADDDDDDDDDDAYASDSVSSDIAPQKVDSVTKSGKPSEGIAM